jgi:hypothetical protein
MSDSSGIGNRHMRIETTLFVGEAGVKLSAFTSAYWRGTVAHRSVS